MMIFFAVALAHFIALISPGPDFLLIIKSTLRNSRRVAFGVVSGIATMHCILYSAWPVQALSSPSLSR